MSGQWILDDHGAADYLRRTGLIGADGELIVEAAGDGNINWVRRIRSAGGRSWIVKQARDALERFPQYQAFSIRLVYEARYLETARRHDRGGVLPEVLHFDEENRVLVLEDLGSAPRMDERLRQGHDINGELESLCRFLARVHAATGDEVLAERFANHQMRRLHGDHIFLLPFRDNSFDLDDAVAVRAMAIRDNQRLVQRIDRAYSHYLTPRGALVHADVQGSNILLADRGPVLLDAEIAHIGDPAFDLGTVVAHVYMPAIATGDPAPAHATTRKLLATYGDERRVPDDFAERVQVYAAIEIMRRTIGAARVDVTKDVRTALRCLDLAEAVLLDELRIPA